VRQPGRADGCAGKAAFATFARATAAATRGARRHEDKMNVYRCRFCGQFHVGEARPEPKRPRRHSMLEEGDG
jgi:rubrerythrin